GRLQTTAPPRPSPPLKPNVRLIMPGASLISATSSSDPSRHERYKTNTTFNTCDFKPGGRWSFIMHGPDGRSYPNENVFAEIRQRTKLRPSGRPSRATVE